MQHWFKLAAEKIQGERRIPAFASDDAIAKVFAAANMTSARKANEIDQIQRRHTDFVVFYDDSVDGVDYFKSVENLHLSQCESCDDIAVWVHKTLVFPPKHQGAEPNPDIPADIVYDIQEARSILTASPRGAAALLRLAIQKLLKHLGESGQDINKDIGSLVGKGLDPRVQQALDVVRVIGNEAVHPGDLDLRDDRDTVIKLLEIVNLIAMQMITVPNSVESLYKVLPPRKLEGIEARDKGVRDEAKSSGSEA